MEEMLKILNEVDILTIFVSMSWFGFEFWFWIFWICAWICAIVLLILCLCLNGFVFLSLCFCVPWMDKIWVGFVEWEEIHGFVFLYFGARYVWFWIFWVCLYCKYVMFDFEFFGFVFVFYVFKNTAIGLSL